MKTLWTALFVLLFASYAHGAQQLSGSWTDNSSNETGFGIEAAPTSTGAFSPLQRVGPNVVTFTDATLSDAQTRCYRVYAFNNTGNSAFSNVACGTAAATLTATKTGTGTGTITSSPAGLNCGAVCSGLVPGNAVITLTAATGTNSQFAGWSGACTGTGSCVVTMNQARSVGAAFDAIPAPTSPTVVTFPIPCTVPNSPGVSCMITITTVP